MWLKIGEWNEVRVLQKWSLDEWKGLLAEWGGRHMERMRRKELRMIDCD